jgi:pimeloyl-ACP methyl ester carboxylesterase
MVEVSSSRKGSPLTNPAAHGATAADAFHLVIPSLDSALTRDDLLDNISMYWLTNTGISSARLYWENNRLDKGGHFAAWEQPQLFADEMRASFRSLR